MDSGRQIIHQIRSTYFSKTNVGYSNHESDSTKTYDLPLCHGCPSVEEVRGLGYIEQNFVEIHPQFLRHIVDDRLITAKATSFCCRDKTYLTVLYRVMDGQPILLSYRGNVFNPFKPSGVKWLHYKVFKAILV